MTSWTVEGGSGLDRSWKGHGLGAYGELMRANGSTIAGGGLTYVRTRQPFAIAPSVGLYHRWDGPMDQTGVAASVYVGTRFFELERFDLPFGLVAELASTGLMPK